MILSVTVKISCACIELVTCLLIKISLSTNSVVR